jgi:hypothetical protein
MFKFGINCHLFKAYQRLRLNLHPSVLAQVYGKLAEYNHPLKTFTADDIKKNKDLEAKITFLKTASTEFQLLCTDFERTFVKVNKKANGNSQVNYIHLQNYIIIFSSRKSPLIHCSWHGCS